MCKGWDYASRSGNGVVLCGWKVGRMCVVGAGREGVGGTGRDFRGFFKR